MSFSIVLLVFSLQIISLAVDDPNQSSQKEKKKLSDYATIEEVLSSRLPHEQIIDNIIRILSAESVEESLNKLDEIDLYIKSYQLLMDTPDRGIPLDVSVGQKDIVAIMGHRRFLKVVDEFSLLSRKEAARLVSREIISSLSEYNKLFDSYMKRHAKMFKHNQKRPRGKKRKSLGFTISVRDGKPTLIAVRYKVLALVLISGNLQLQQAQPAVTKVLETAIEQRDIFYNRGLFDEFDAWFMLMDGSLYNRQIVATAVLGTYVDPDKQKEILKQFRCKFKSERLTRYNAAVAPYGLSDFPPESGPIDYSKGELTVKYLEPLNDSKFDDIINAAIKARQQNMTPTEPKE
ncbi:MAG: hypothetical protein ACYS30_09645 [Planctomycetota bacterium]